MSVMNESSTLVAYKKNQPKFDCEMTQNRSQIWNYYLKTFFAIVLTSNRQTKVKLLMIN